MKNANSQIFILGLALLLGLPIYLVNAELVDQILLDKNSCQHCVGESM